MSAVPKMQRKEIEKLYDLIKSGKISTKDIDKVSNEVPNSKYTPKQVQSIKGLVYRSAQNSSKEDFVNFLDKGEMPPIKLTQEEMELVKGGLAPLIVAGCFVFGILMYAALKSI